MNFITLNNGVEMPQIGLGTAFIPLEKLSGVLSDAYSLGYRKFDTAWRYGNEHIIGEKFKKNIIPRSEIFLTTKIHAEDLYHFSYRRFAIPKKSVRTAIENHCKRLSTDCIDLLLVHWPFRQYLHIYEEILNFINSGSSITIRAVGVSSWLGPHLKKGIEKTGVTPALNQFEINPYLTNAQLTAECRNLNITVESYSSLGSQNSKEILSDPVILRIAENIGASPAQTILRWLTQKGISVVPRSSSPRHLESNLNSLDFTLTNDDIEAIDNLNRNSYCGHNPNFTLQWV